MEYSLLYDFQMIVFVSFARFECRRDNAVGVEVLMVALELADLMKNPVFIEVAAGMQDPKTQNSFGAFQAPTCAGDFHAVFDQMTAGAFNDARGNGISLIKITIVLEKGALGEQVVRAGIHGFAFGSGKISQGGAATHAAGHISGIATDGLEPPT